MSKTKEEPKTAEETAEYLEALAQLDKIRYVMARAMLIKFGDATIGELVNYIDYTMQIQADTGFNMEQWLVHQLQDTYAEWKNEDTNASLSE